MQEPQAACEEGTFLDHFFLHSNPKDLPQTGQVAVNRGGIPPSKLARLARVANLIVSLPLYQFRERKVPAWSFGEGQGKKNGQIAHRRIVVGPEILRDYARNNNSPATPQ
jgi:hypothetical protein